MQGEEPEEGEGDVAIRNKTVIFISIICLISAVLMAGCGTDETNDAQEDHDISIFFGSMDDPIEIDAILTEYETETGVKIDPVIVSDSKDNIRTLETILKDTEQPAAYAVAGDEDIEGLSKGGFIADFPSVPYIMDGYGLAYDSTIFTEMLGKNKAQKLINSLRKASYDEWKVFVEALSNYINNRDQTSFSIGAASYELSGKKGDLTKDLNGVFAVPGADSSVYGDDILGILMQTANLEKWENAKDDMTGSAMQTLDPVLTSYINGVDLMTAYLCGEYSAGIRGSDFANEEYYSLDKTNAMFMEGKSVFSIVASKSYEELEKLNAKKAQTLAYLPIKMPYANDAAGTTSEGAIANNCIPASISYSFYINDKCDKEQQKKALDFLTWFTEKKEMWGNPLSTSIETYAEEGNVIKNHYDPEELADWKEEILGEDGFVRFLRKEQWSDDYKNEMKLYLTETWCEN